MLGRLALLLAAGTAIGLVGWIALSRGGEEAKARAAVRPHATPVVEAAAPQPPADGGTRRGTTKFVRRLEAGGDLMRLLDDVEMRGVALAGFEDRYQALKPFLLKADGEPKEPERPTRTLVRLTVPPRDLSSLLLAGAPAGDPLGTSMTVRIWTRETRHPEDARARATATIHHIVKQVGGLPGGTDVLVTEGRGHDVFPFQSGRWYAAGMYFLRDEYSVVGTDLSPAYQIEVIEHECIHALHHSLGSKHESRFIVEGLAEYLRLVEPGSPGLDVPPEALADPCAELRRILERMESAGIGIGTIDPRRLVDLSVRDFYALRHLGYLVAQLTMAYLGGGAIERSLAAGSDAAIIEGVRRIAWLDFLRFVNEGARGGTLGRARVVQDIPYEWSWHSPPAFLNALKAIGAKLPAQTGPVRSRLALAARADAYAESLELVLLTLASRPWTLRVSVDLSADMDRPVRLLPVPQEITEHLNGAPQGATPRHFARELLALLAAGRSVEFVGLTKEPGADNLDLVAPLDLARLMSGATPAAHVVIVGSKDIEDAVLGLTREPGDVVLVVDLTPDGGAIEIARLMENNPTVAYWRPVTD